MAPDIAQFVDANIPPELVTLAIVLGGLSGTFFFVWGFVAPVVTAIRNLIVNLSYREIQVHVADPDYYKFNLWLNTHRKHTHFQRSFKVVNSYGSLEEYDDGTIDDEFIEADTLSTLVPGFGSVMVKAPGMPMVWVTRSKEESNQTYKQTETLRFRIFSFRQRRVDEFFEQVVTSVKSSKGPKVYASHNNYWTTAGVPRQVLPPLSSSSKAFVDDVGNFLASRDQYLRRGIPYKRGYLLAGPPGTGKSSDIAYVANKFGMSIYTLGSESILKFEALRGNIVPGSIICIEDMDLTIVGSKRKNLDKRPKDDEESSDSLGDMVHSETLREFMNALDGITEFSGSIIVATTNKPTALDPALLRPGRIDQTFEVGPYTPEEQIAHVNRFFELELDVADFPQITERTVAEIQFLCTTHMNDVDEVLHRL